MATTKNDHPFLQEFKNFMRFLQSLWGILSGLSVFFPLSNVLAQAIPLGYGADESAGALDMLSPTLVTALTTVATLFVIMQTFRQREHMKRHKQKDTLHHQAWVSFGIGIAALLLYLAVNFSVYSVFYAPLNIWSGDPRRLIGDFLLLLFYGIFFSQLTRAFVLMGMIEYFGRTKQQPL